jgi:hypothetical protein
VPLAVAAGVLAAVGVWQLLGPGLGGPADHGTAVPGLLASEARDGPRLSVYSATLPDRGWATFGKSVRQGGREYSVDSRGDLSVVAWTEGPNTYVLCADVPEERLLRIAAASQTGPAGGP